MVYVTDEHKKCRIKPKHLLSDRLANFIIFSDTLRKDPHHEDTKKQDESSNKYSKIRETDTTRGLPRTTCISLDCILEYNYFGGGMNP